MKAEEFLEKTEEISPLSDQEEKVTTEEQDIDRGSFNIVQKGQPVQGPPEEGIYEMYHGSGHLVSCYEKGQKQGETLIYDKEGTLTHRVTYQQDCLQGPASSYFSNQTTEMTFVYQDDVLQGPIVSFYPNGVKCFEGTLKQGKLEGDFIFYDEKGDVCQKAVYKEGLRHGPCTTYFPKSQGGGLCQTEVYEKGLLTKNQDLFYSTGELLQRTPYEKGKALNHPIQLNKKGKPITDPANKNRKD